MFKLKQINVVPNYYNYYNMQREERGENVRYL